MKNRPDVEDAQGLLHNAASLLLHVEGDPEVKRAVLTILDRARAVIASL